MVSYRCQRCWISLETRAKAITHPETSNCLPKERPTNERFMELAHEAEVDRYFGRMTDKEVWWTLFQLLIQEIRHLDKKTLKKNYSPCKFSFEVR